MSSCSFYGSAHTINAFEIRRVTTAYNKAFKSDSQRVAFLLCGGLSDLGGSALTSVLRCSHIWSLPVLQVSSMIKSAG